MGMDIHVRIAKYNVETNLYEELQLFRKRKPNEKEYDYKTGEPLPWNDFKKIHIWLGRNYEMFEGMRNGTTEDGYGYFPWTSINLSSLESSFAEKIKKKMSCEGMFDFKELTLADMYNYIYNHPTVVDYEEKEEDWVNWEPGDPVPQKENPIKSVMEKIRDFISIADEDFDWMPWSYYKIIFYFDW